MQELKTILSSNVNNVNKITNSNVITFKTTGIEVHRIASYIADKLQDHNSINFFCKVAWQIPEHKLILMLEQAMTGRSPARLFTWLCTQELSREDPL